MNYDRMRTLAGVPAVAPKALVIETVEEVVADVTAEEVVADEVVADEVVSVEVVADEVVAVEVVVAEAEEVKVDDKAPELNTKAEKAGSKVKVPADVTSAISSRIAELKQSIAQYNEKGYNDGGVKVNAIEALEQIAADLKLEDGLTIANIFYGTLMSPITDLLPPKVVKFLHSSTVTEGKNVKIDLYGPKNEKGEHPYLFSTTQFSSVRDAVASAKAKGAVKGVIVK